MFYIIGFLRRTPLFGLIALPISIFIFNADFKTICESALNPTNIAGCFAAFMFWSIFAYPICVSLHLIIIKILKRPYGLLDTYFSALGADLTAPIRYIGTFFAVITGKHKIKDDSTFHDMCDYFQVIFGFLWTLVMTVFFIIGFLNIDNL